MLSFRFSKFECTEIEDNGVTLYAAFPSTQPFPARILSQHAAFPSFTVWQDTLASYSIMA